MEEIKEKENSENQKFYPMPNRHERRRLEKLNKLEAKKILRDKKGKNK